MTTIAYHPDNGGMLAADTLITLSDTRYFGPKVHRLDDGSIFGGGMSPNSSSELVDIAKWLNKPTGKPPKFTGIRALHLTKDGLFLYANRPTPTELDRRYPTAVGSGQDAALAILRTGGSAEAAIRAAMLVDINTGGDVDVMYLSPA